MKKLTEHQKDKLLDSYRYLKAAMNSLGKVSWVTKSGEISDSSLWEAFKAAKHCEAVAKKLHFVEKKRESK